MLMQLHLIDGVETKKFLFKSMESVQIGLRKSCFGEEDDGLASLADMEAGFSGSFQALQKSYNLLFTRPLCYARRSGSFRNFPCLVSPCDSPRSARFYDTRFEDHRPHFLEACFGCKKPLGDNKDIFMYKGDTPFCSEECRQEQIEIDESKERNWNLASLHSSRKKDQKMSTSTKAQDYSSQTGTVAAA